MNLLCGCMIVLKARGLRGARNIKYEAKIRMTVQSGIEQEAEPVPQVFPAAGGLVGRWGISVCGCPRCFVFRVFLGPESPGGKLRLK